LRPTRIQGIENEKVYFVLAVIIGFVTSLNAQTLVGTLPRMDIVGIPGCFTNSGHSYISLWDSHDVNIYVYDKELTNCLTIVSSEVSGNYFSNYVDLSTGYYGLPGSSSHPTEGMTKLIFTQNLFNSDDNFEYLSVGDDVVEIKTIVGNTPQTIQTIIADEGCHWYGKPTIARIDDIYYLVLVSGPDDFLRDLVFYRIKQSQGLTKVDAPLPISVFPTMPTREEQITVELGEGTNATEITVVNSLGQVVKRVPVEEGQCTVTIPARDLGSGLNVVNTRSNKGQGSCKIIVR
jgi:hypothetical protein